MTVISPWRMKAAVSYMQIALRQVYNCLAHVPSECLTKLKVFQLCKFVLCVVKRPANLSMPFPLTQGYIEHRNRMSFSNVNLQRVDAGNSILCTYQPTQSFPSHKRIFAVQQYFARPSITTSPFSVQSQLSCRYPQKVFGIYVYGCTAGSKSMNVQ